jgi:hypothetical protein
MCFLCCYTVTPLLQARRSATSRRPKNIATVKSIGGILKVRVQSIWRLNTEFHSNGYTLSSEGEGEISGEQRVILAQKATTVGVGCGFSFTLTDVYRAQFGVRMPWSSQAKLADIQRNRADFQRLYHGAYSGRPLGR